MIKASPHLYGASAGAYDEAVAGAVTPGLVLGACGTAGSS